ncbi:MAG: hypothetical protein QW292_00855 [Candidatus Parvarchaeota archaeon]
MIFSEFIVYIIPIINRITPIKTSRPAPPGIIELRLFSSVVAYGTDTWKTGIAPMIITMKPIRISEPLIS